MGRIMLTCLCTSVVVLAFAVLPAAAQPPVDVVYPDGFIGRIFKYEVRAGESLLEIGRRFGLGSNEVIAANSGVNPYLPPEGTTVTIAAAWIPPPVPVRPSLVVNVAELRLYFFPESRTQKVLSFPIGIGDEGTDTPLGVYTVDRKSVHPSWYVPASILRVRKDLRPVVPPGSDNPLGTRALYLSRSGILIHGTNRPWGIGRRSSHGCIRLYPEDVVKLFERVATGTPVHIVNRPLKIGAKGDRVFLEVHGDGKDGTGPGEVLHLMARLGFLHRIDFGLVIRAVGEKRGYPVEVTPGR